MPASFELTLPEMNNEVEILYVGDNINDAELAMRALKKNTLAKDLVRVCDGEQALHYIFDRGQYKFIDSVSNLGSYWIYLNQQPEIKSLII